MSSLSDTTVGLAIVVIAVVIIVIERIWDQLPASHWINQTRDYLRRDSEGGLDLGDAWDDDSFGCDD